MTAMAAMALVREPLWREPRLAPGRCTELRGDSTIDVRAGMQRVK